MIRGDYNKLSLALCFIFFTSYSTISVVLIFSVYISQPVYNQWGNYRTYLFTDQAVNLINSHDTSKPFFLYLAHEAVHGALDHEPLEAPGELIHKFDKSIHDDSRRIFAAMATALDQSVGKVFSIGKYEVMKDMEHGGQVISRVCRSGGLLLIGLGSGPSGPG